MSTLATSSDRRTRNTSTINTVSLHLPHANGIANTFFILIDGGGVNMTISCLWWSQKAIPQSIGQYRLVMNKDGDSTTLVEEGLVERVYLQSPKNSILSF